MSDLDVKSNVEAMSRLIGELIALVMQTDQADGEFRRLSEIIVTLGRLIAATATLPEGVPSNLPEGIGVPVNLRKSIASSFPSLGLYWVVFDATDMTGSPEPVVGDAVDDLLEIIEDLCIGMAASRESPEAAIWHWRHGFESHWGRHAAHLQSVVTQILRRSRSVMSCQGQTPIRDNPL